MYSISSFSTTRRHVGHFFSRGILKTMSQPNSSFSIFLFINQSLCRQIKWNRWKHPSTLSRSYRDENIKSWRESWSPAKFSRQIAQRPLRVSLYSVRISLMRSWASYMSPWLLSSSLRYYANWLSLYKWDYRHVYSWAILVLISSIWSSSRPFTNVNSKVGASSGYCNIH